MQYNKHHSITNARRRAADHLGRRRAADVPVRRGARGVAVSAPQRFRRPPPPRCLNAPRAAISLYNVCGYIAHWIADLAAKGVTLPLGLPGGPCSTGGGRRRRGRDPPAAGRRLEVRREVRLGPVLEVRREVAVPTARGTVRSTAGAGPRGTARSRRTYGSRYGAKYGWGRRLEVRLGPVLGGF